MNEEQDWNDALEVRKQLLSLMLPLEEFMKPYSDKGDFKDLYSELQTAIRVTNFGIKTCNEQIEFAKQRENHGN
jgi:hypothetical protein